MKEIIIAVLTLWLLSGAITHSIIVRELKTDLKVEKELYKACSAELQWKGIQLKGAN